MRAGIFDDSINHGPRGIAFDNDGNAWITDDDYLGTDTERVKRFDKDGNRLAGVGRRGAWSDGRADESTAYGSFLGLSAVSIAKAKDGSMLAAASYNWGDTSAEANRVFRLVHWAADGTPLPSILLKNLPVAAAAQAALGTTVHIDAHGVSVDPETGNIYISPTAYYKNGQNPKASGGVFVLNPEGTEVLNYFTNDGLSTTGSQFGPDFGDQKNSANYGTVFAWSQTGTLRQFTASGDYIRQVNTGNTADDNAQQGVEGTRTPNVQRVAVPGMTTPRGITYDSDGLMYVTAQEGLDTAGVRILGLTPRPITNLKATQLADGQVKLTWDHGEAVNTSVAKTQDYVVEMTTDGGTTWKVVSTDKSTAKEQLLPESTLTGLYKKTVDKQVGFRVSAWNGAGNGDWVAQALVPNYELTKTGVANAECKVDWTVEVKNTGNVKITDLQLTDVLVDENGAALAGRDITLDNGGVVTELAVEGTKTFNFTTDPTDDDRTAGVLRNKVDGKLSGETPATGDPNTIEKSAKTEVNLPSYTVTYTDGVDGEEVFADQVTENLGCNADTPQFDTDPGAGVTPGNPTREGYVFKGWNPSVADKVTGNVTYTAQWTPNTYTVTYVDGVDGEEVFADQVNPDLPYGTATPGFNGTPTRVGYTFAGWNPTVADTVTGNVTYTAQWNQDKYTVTYVDGVDGEEVFADQVNPDLPYGAATPGFNGTPTREGYIFKGWNPSVADTVTGSITYTAQWEAVVPVVEKYTVIYTDGVDGEEVFADQVNPDLTLGEPTPAFNGTPTREGYTFEGWNPTVADTVTGNITYTAQWKAKVVTPEPVVPPADPSSNNKCVAQFSSFQNPIIWLIPLGLMSTIKIPAAFQQQVEQSVRAFTEPLERMGRKVGEDIGRGLNLPKQNNAFQVKLPQVELPAYLNINNYMTPEAQGHLFNGAVIVAAMLGVAGYIANDCSFSLQTTVKPLGSGDTGAQSSTQSQGSTKN